MRTLSHLRLQTHTWGTHFPRHPDTQTQHELVLIQSWLLNAREREDVAGSHVQLPSIISLRAVTYNPSESMLLTRCQRLPPTLTPHLDCITVYSTHEWAQQVPQESICPSTYHRPVSWNRENFISWSFLPAHPYFTTCAMYNEFF